MPRLLRRLADVEAEESLSNRLRSRRFSVFAKLVEGIERPIHILDVGGTVRFWEQRGWADQPGIVITLLNLQTEESVHNNIRSTLGSALDMAEYSDGSFDIVFSNSVIEHLFTIGNQKKMAKEVQRVGRAYWVQTPNYWFPIEPHFHVPGWQWYPQSVRIACLRRWRCGWRGPCPDLQEAGELVREVRLLRGREMRDLFPSGEMWGERFGGLVKSWVAYGGFPTQEDRSRSFDVA